jgi:hypothetical protein
VDFDLLNWLSERYQKDQVHYPYWHIPAERVDAPAFANNAVKAGENYFRCTVSEMFLKDDRKWFTEWQPAVYAAIRFRFGDQDQSLNHVAGPSGVKDLDSSHMNVGARLNYSITPLVPFNGGDIEIEAGLVAIKGGDNDIHKLLDVLGGFSKALAIPQLSTALKFAGPLADGIAKLLGVAGNHTELRLHDTFNSGNPLKPGYLLTIADDSSELEAEKCFVKQDRLYYGGSLNSAAPLTGYSYVLLRIDTPEERDDWESLSAIDDPYKSAIEMLQTAMATNDPKLQQGMMEEADRRIGAAKLAVYRSKELTRTIGINQVMGAIEARYADAKKRFASHGATEVKVARDLKSAMAGRMSPREALLRGPMQEEDLWRPAAR